MSKPVTAQKLLFPVFFFAEKSFSAVVSIIVSVTSLKIGNVSERFTDFT